MSMETNENNNQEDVVFEPPTNQVANQFEEKDLDEGEVFRLLTPKLLGEFEEMRAERKKRVKEAKNKQIVIKERIVDGEIVYENEENEEDEEIVYNDDYDDTDTTLTEGNLVPARLGLIPKKILQKPAIEIDPFIHKRLQSFVVLSKRFNKVTIHRFSSTKSLFLFSPFNKLRRGLIWFSTWQFFDWFMILTILVNLIILAIPLSDSQSNIAEYVFQFVYTIEAVIKITARGFVLKPYTYLRDPWNIIDFVILIISFVSIILANATSNSSSNLQALRAFRVLRVLKTVNVIPSLKVVVNAILRSLPMFLQVIGIMFLLCLIFALYCIQAFIGTSSQKCVSNYNQAYSYTRWINNQNNWYYDSSIGSDQWLLCANGSASNEGRTCPAGYTCLRGIGQNPNDGLSHFDNAAFALSLMFQTFTLDSWNDVYQMALDTNGAWNMIYFVLVVFAGAFYLVNLTFPVMAVAYNVEMKITAQKQEAAEKDLVFDINTLKNRMAEKKKELEEYERLHPIKEKDDNESEDSSKPDVTEGIWARITDGFFQDDSDTAAVAQIKLSENLGGYNEIIREGLPNAHFHGRELVADDRAVYPCLKLGPLYLKFIRVQDFFLKIVTNIYFELFVALCVILNTIVMSLTYYGQPDGITVLQNVVNYFVFGVFVIEAIFKIIALGRLYFLDLINWFDLIIIILCIVEFSVPNVRGLSVFRTVRLIRIFSLAKSWKSMGRILRIIGFTIEPMIYVIIILVILLFIFAVLGNGLFEQSYSDYYTASQMPSWNFKDVPHALLAMFRTFCGSRVNIENECWLAAGPLCVVVFYPVTIFGNFMIMDLILTVILSAFSQDNLKKVHKDEQDDRLQHEIERFKRWFYIALDECFCCFKKLPCFKKNPKVWPDETTLTEHNGTDKDNVSYKASITESELVFSSIMTKEKKKRLQEERMKRKLVIEKENMKRVQEKNMIKAPKGILHPCFPKFVYKKVCKCLNDENKVHKAWTKFRRVVLKIVESSAFEAFILLVILGSSITLAFNDVNLRNGTVAYQVLSALDVLFAFIFLVEMILKLIGFGFKKYFTDPWCILDFFIVIVSVLSSILAYTISSSVGFLKAFRTLRALRPLRVISRIQGVKTVVNTLIYSIPPLINVLIICLIVWLIFSIIGVNLFNGLFYRCVFTSNGKLTTGINTKQVCVATSGVKWYNPLINFDNVASGLLALFQVATFSGWIDIISNSAAITNENQQPTKDNSEWTYIYYIFFVMVVGIYLLKLIVAVIIDCFIRLKKQFQIGVIDIFLTPNQRRYLQTVNQIGQVFPTKATQPPKNKFQKFLYIFTLSPRFELSITFVLILNMILISVEYYSQSNSYTNVVNVLNILFVMIYGFESLIKLLALDWHFFRNYWNVFDLLINILSVAYAPLEGYMTNIIVQPNLLRLWRLFRIGSSLRHYKFAKGIRKILYTIVISIPSAFYIGLLLFLVLFIYSIIGMNFFMNVKLINGLTETECFQSFGKSMTTLFRIATGGDWNYLLNGLSISDGDPGIKCDSSFDIQSQSTSYDTARINGCGSFGIAVPYLVTFVILTKIIILSLFLAVLLENYELANSLEDNGITQDDFTMFHAVWQQYDPYATQFIRLNKLSNFIADLNAPFGVPKPNENALALFNVPIVQDEMVHVLDVLHAVAKYAVGKIEEDEEFEDMQRTMDIIFLRMYPIRMEYLAVNSTLQKKKHDLAAKKIQKAWKNYQTKKGIIIT